jgi:hypothetical protein
MNSAAQDRDSSPTTQESIEDWEAKVHRLQEIICILLVKNQAMRTALSSEMRGEAKTSSE